MSCYAGTLEQKSTDERRAVVEKEERTGAGTALLVIDVQNAMVEAAYRGEELLENIGGLLGRARDAGVPVVYVQHDEEDYGPMKPGNPGWRIHDRIAPGPEDPVVRKKESDSFYETNLGEELRSRGVGRLVVTGMSSEFCVDTTCKSALSRDYGVTLVSDGHTTASDEVLEMMGRGAVSAAQIVAHHNDVMGGFSHPDRVQVKTAAEISFAQQTK